MSHLKNVEAFEKLLGICTGLGGNYNPGKQNLQVESITASLANARALLDAVQVARRTFVNVSNKREEVFEGMRKLAQRIINDLKSSVAPQKSVTDAMSVYRKLVGYRVSRDPVMDAGESKEAKPKTRRARGEDYLTQADNFKDFIGLVSNEPKYNPGIAELKVPALQEVLNELIQHNARSMEAKRKWLDACAQRNNALYRVPGNMVESARGIKYQLRAIQGLKSQEYKQASRIHVNKP